MPATKTRRAPAKRSRNESPEQRAARGAKTSMTRTVRRYLEALESSQTRRVDPAKLQERLNAVMTAIVEANNIERVRLIQERMDLERQIDAVGSSDDYAEVEAAAIEVLADWARDKGVSYQALREAGVPAAVLREAGMSRSS
jgi:ATP-dependent protease HslVU (ClpYQ) peptidase subunit